jgi:hypothetical protein
VDSFATWNGIGDVIAFGIKTLPQLLQPGRTGQDVSLLLLEEVARTRRDDDEAYGQILNGLRMPNGTFRATEPGRFRLLDSLVSDILRGRVGRDCRVFVTDCAVADGTTSVALYRTLRSAFPRLDFVASDLWHRAVAVKSRRWPWAVALDSDGLALQIIAGPLVIAGQGALSRAYPVNRAVRLLARAWLVPRARAILRQIDATTQADFATVTIDGYDVTTLPLLGGECLHLSQTASDFRFEVQDLFRSSRRRAHVVRVMNALTRNYFDDARLRQAIRLRLDSVLSDGLFIAGRSPTTNPRGLLASVFGRTSTGFEVIARLNGGCEEEALILETAHAGEMSAIGGEV